MLGFLTPAGRNDSPLVNVTAADRFWHLLPRSDAVGAAKQLSDALSDLGTQGAVTVDQLRAVLTLDKRAHSLFDAFLPDLSLADMQERSEPTLEKRHVHAAFDLSQSFGQAYVQMLRQVRSASSGRSWREYAPLVLLRLLRHRQTELLLRPFASGQHFGVGWTVLHDAYRYAESQGLLKAAAKRRDDDEDAPGHTLEQEYVHTLLLDWINSGQFSPSEAFWVHVRLNRWCDDVSLVPGPESMLVPLADNLFAVDFDSDAGLRRMPPRPTGRFCTLDPAPLLAQIDKEITSLRETSLSALGWGLLGRNRRLKLLRKLALQCAAKPERIRRRGERKAVTMSVQAVRGLALIVRALRHGLWRESTVVETEAPQVEEITITVDGGYTETPNTAQGADKDTHGSRGSGPRAKADAAPVPDAWQLKDKSESGCRLQGQVADCRSVVPGSLIMVRESESAPWSLVMVRRLKKLVGTHVDLGVEYIGREPRVVALEVVDGDGAYAATSSTKHPHRFAGLYLGESATQPRMPIKTLIIPAREFHGEGRLTLRSANAIYTVRMKAPLEEQCEFVWLPYEIVGQQGLERAA
jgi:hypothetical protein